MNNIIDKTDKKNWVKEVKTLYCEEVDAGQMEQYVDHMTHMGIRQKQFDMTQEHHMANMENARYDLEIAWDAVDLAMHRVRELWGEL